MNDEIKRAWIQWNDFKGHPDDGIFISTFEAGYTSRDDEVSELVEVLKDVFFTRPQTTGTLGAVDQDYVVKILNRYTKNLCPECGGSGQRTIISGVTPETYDAVNTDCDTCHGRGYKWERRLL